MKGFVLNIGEKTVCGAIDNGITSVLISNKEGPFRLYFGSMDNKNISYIWYVADLQLGDSFAITYEEVEHTSEPQRIGDGRNTPEDDLRLLESYHKLKQELIDEGLISTDE